MSGRKIVLGRVHAPLPTMQARQRTALGRAWARPLLAILTGLLLIGSNAQAAEVVISIKNVAFSTSALEVKVGDKVTFLNNDPIKHNVYSPTEPGAFDLGAYGKDQSKSVEFQTEGVHEVRCSIHPNMKMTIDVRK